MKYFQLFEKFTEQEIFQEEDWIEVPIDPEFHHNTGVSSRMIDEMIFRTHLFGDLKVGDYVTDGIDVYRIERLVPDSKIVKIRNGKPFGRSEKWFGRTQFRRLVKREDYHKYRGNFAREKFGM